MDHRRYDLRKEPDGTWKVIDVFTGWPSYADGMPSTGLDLQDADDLVDQLNYWDAKRRGILKRR